MRVCVFMRVRAPVCMCVHVCVYLCVNVYVYVCGVCEYKQYSDLPLQPLSPQVVRCPPPVTRVSVESDNVSIEVIPQEVAIDRC